ncbi:MAG: MOSC domain-containing protein [Elusimicrobia bacterium]|nr:MOSC domain-containing protein [Elusimicrobiota bacterium]
MSPGKVVSLNVSAKTGTKKVPVRRVRIGPQGIEGDAHAGRGPRQVSLLSQEEIDRFSAEAAGGKPYPPGVFAENITTSGVDLGSAGLLDRVLVGSAVLEVTQIGKECHGQGCSVFAEAGRCVMPQAGVFARVVRGGTARPGDRVELERRPLRIAVITLSDRASAGVYEDLSGPRVRELLTAFLSDRRWHPEFDCALIPDSKAALGKALRKAVQAGSDIVFTTGGTGIGLRDITPEVVEGFADKLIPGVMDSIRLKHGDRLPSALLSRSVAAVKGRTLIYALPGSVKAVTEYMAELTLSMEHALAMLHGLGH